MPALHFLASAIAVLVYVLTARASGERRAPTAAIAWVLGIVALPYVVLPLYFLFGRRKFHRIALAPLPPPLPRHWASDLLAAFGLPPPRAAIVRLHADGAMARRSLLDLIDSARSDLDVATFLVGDDAFAREVVDALVRRASDGVRVRFLVDGAGILLGARALLDSLRSGGVSVRLFHPPLALRASGPRNLRNHRKCAIADGHHLWSGGRNLAAEYFLGRVGEMPWTDLSFDIEGEAAIDAARQFELDWQSSTRERGQKETAAIPHVPASTDSTHGSAAMTALAQYVPSGPDQNEDTVRAVLVAACFHAERRILAVTPYFVPDDALRNALRLAARRGVEIVLVIPRRSNHGLADIARGRALRELAGVGVRVRLVPHMVHAKAVVVDDALALAGSVNLDIRSLMLNYEAAVLFYGNTEIHWLTTWIDALAARSEEYQPDPPGFLRDIGEGLLLAVAFQL